MYRANKKRPNRGSQSKHVTFVKQQFSYLHYNSTSVFILCVYYVVRDSSTLISLGLQPGGDQPSPAQLSYHFRICPTIDD